MQYRAFTYLLSLAAALWLSTAAVGCGRVDGREGAAVPVPTPELVADVYSVVRWSADQLAPAESDAFSVAANSLRPLLPTTTTIETPVVTAAKPFNYVVAEWRALIPAGSHLDLRARTADADGGWTDWQPVLLNADAETADPAFFAGAPVGVPDVRSTHTRVQFSIDFVPSASNQMPVLNELAVIFIDSTGPTTQEILREGLNPSRKLAQPAPSTVYPKPPVVSRAQWCTHPDCNYTGVDYHPVTHLVVHHTVSNNGTTDWAANVRAIWTYHTFSRGWGDIGYNYLVDPNGVIYEGHLGGDDVVGTHASGANRGSMGVALLGTFTDVPPPEAMLNAVAELLAWKVSQRQIVMWDASRLPDMNWGLLHLVGHRDVYGTTTCPGTTAHSYLPNLRQRIANRLGIAPGYIILDELEPGFTKSVANWYDGPSACGYNQHAYYTFSTTSPGLAINTGEWRPNLPATGLYRVEAFVPYCNTATADTQQAPYTIIHAQGTTRIVRNQQANLGLWMSLGEYTFNTGSGGVIRLNDLTTSENNRPIWFDALRFTLLDLAVANISPSQDQWLTNRAVTFNWTLTGASGVSQVRLQVATDANFTNRVLDQSVTPTTTTYTHTFDRDYADLFWRVQATRTTGGELSSQPTRFHIDATPPTSRVHTLWKQCDGNFTLFWEGSDNLSGVASYTVAYRAPGDANWTTLLANTTLTEYTWRPANPSANYLFRSQAVDGRGNAEPLKPNGDLSAADGIPCNIDPPVNVAPAVNAWVNNRSVAFRWNIALPQAVAAYRLEVAADAGFGQLLAARDLPGSATTAVVTLDADYSALYWRVTATTVLSRQFTSAATIFRLDATPPTSRVTDVWQRANGDFTLFWSGADALSGVRDYTVEVRNATGGAWSTVLANTTLTTATYRPPDPSAVYLFRSRARDLADNLEPAKPDGDLSSNDGCPYIGAPTALLEPPPDGWRSGQATTFRWQQERPRCLTEVRLDVATDPAFANVVLTRTFAPPVDRFNFSFGPPYSELFWRVTQRTVLAETFTSAVARVRFDRTPPTSAVVEVRETIFGGYQVTTAGSDAQSGIAGYIFEYRAEGSSVWQRFAVGPTEQAIMQPPDPAALYWFRSLAMDAAGNVQPATSNGDLSSASAVRVNRTWLPMIFR